MTNREMMDLFLARALTVSVVAGWASHEETVPSPFRRCTILTPVKCVTRPRFAVREKQGRDNALSVRVKCTPPQRQQSTRTVTLGRARVAGWFFLRREARWSEKHGQTHSHANGKALSFSY